MTPIKRATQALVDWMNDRLTERMDDEDCEELQEMIAVVLIEERQRVVTLCERAASDAMHHGTYNASVLRAIRTVDDEYG